MIAVGLLPYLLLAALFAGAIAAPQPLALACLFGYLAMGLLIAWSWGLLDEEDPHA